MSAMVEMHYHNIFTRVQVNWGWWQDEYAEYMVDAIYLMGSLYRFVGEYTF